MTRLLAFYRSGPPVFSDQFETRFLYFAGAITNQRTNTMKYEFVYHEYVWVSHANLPDRYQAPVVF